MFVRYHISLAFQLMATNAVMADAMGKTAQVSESYSTTCTNVSTYFVVLFDYVMPCKKYLYIVICIYL